ncbi:MAG: copper resistance protein CopC [Chloroflexota bacterium]
MGWRGFLPVLALAYWLLTASAAWAHVELLGSEPPMGAGLTDPPPAVRLWFTEPVAPGFTDLVLLDHRGRRVDAVVARITPNDDRILEAAVGDLTPGVYTVSFRALSAIDGHIERGAFMFSVGTMESLPVQTAVQTLQEPNFWVASALRWVSYLSAMLLVGLPAFRIMIVMPGARHLTEQQMHRLDASLSRLISLSAAGLICASLGQFALQSIDMAADSSLAAMLTAGEGLIVRTRYGSVWLGRLTLALAMLGMLRGALLLDLEERTQRWSGAAVLAVLGLYTFASLAHVNSAFDGAWLGLALSWAHVTSVALWFGGLVGVLVLAVQGVSGQFIARFSKMAFWCFAVILLTGFGQSLVLVGDQAALTQTLPGQLLLGKFTVVALIVLLAWRNRRLVQRPPINLRSLVACVRPEIALALLVLGLTSLIVYLPPAWQTYQQQLRGRPLELQTVVQSQTWLTLIDPGRPGLNLLTVRPPDQMKDRIASARMLVTYQDGDLPPVAERVSLDGDGLLRLSSSSMSVSGRWLIEAVVRLDSGEDLLVQLPVELAGPATPVAPPPALRPGTLGASAIVSLGLMVLGFGLLLFVIRTLGTRTWEARGLILATVAISLLGGYVAVRHPFGEAVTARNRSGSVNPIAASEDSIALGNLVYDQACAQCHGATGRGDGPQMVARGERLTDLRVHLSAGHTDGDLHYWISNGIGGTEMPAFAYALSEDDRWHVVNALRAMTSELKP